MTGNPEDGAPMEIACDESGSDGENLTGGNTDVFAHASVRLTVETAPLSDVRLVATRSDARVQLAGFLAGIARKLASDELNGRGDPALTALLRPYVGAESVRGDEDSGARLGTAEANSAVWTTC